MMIVDQIIVEPYLDENGTLLIREKETKRLVDGLPVQPITIEILADTRLLYEQVKDIEAKIADCKA